MNSHHTKLVVWHSYPSHWREINSKFCPLPWILQGHRYWQGLHGTLVGSDFWSECTSEKAYSPPAGSSICAFKTNICHVRCTSPVSVARCDLVRNYYFISTAAAAHSGAGPPHCRSFTITLRHITLGGAPLDEWSARRRDFYLTTHNTHKGRDVYDPSGIRTHSPSKRTAAKPRLSVRNYNTAKLQLSTLWKYIY
jgi:hypothetical protein